MKEQTVRIAMCITRVCSLTLWSLVAGTSLQESVQCACQRRHIAAKCGEDHSVPQEHGRLCGHERGLCQSTHVILNETIFCVFLDWFEILSGSFIDYRLFRFLTYDIWLCVQGFGDNRPARSAVEVARLPKDALIEIEAIATLPS